VLWLCRQLHRQGMMESTNTPACPCAEMFTPYIPTSMAPG
jgi:hypothetical protein